MFLVTLQALIIAAVFILIVRFVFKAVRGDYDRHGSALASLERSLR